MGTDGRRRGCRVAPSSLADAGSARVGANHLKFVQPGLLTMSSNEIADLTEKDHKNVIRDIRVMLNELGDGSDLSHDHETKDSRGYTAEFSLPKDLALTLVAGYNVRLRKRIVDRWLVLEEKAAGQQFEVPKTLSSALRLAASQAEQIEQ